MLVDAQWMSLEPLIEACRPKGKTPPQDLRRTISAIVWRHENGAKWRAIAPSAAHPRSGCCRRSAAACSSPSRRGASSGAVLPSPSPQPAAHAETRRSARRGLARPAHALCGSPRRQRPGPPRCLAAATTPYPAELAAARSARIRSVFLRSGVPMAVGTRHDQASSLGARDHHSDALSAVPRRRRPR